MVVGLQSQVYEMLPFYTIYTYSFILPGSWNLMLVNVGPLILGGLPDDRDI